ncbi:MAG: DUF4836 family protein [Chitinophagaceae bacterium]
MTRFFRNLLPASVLLFFLASCHSLPDHAKYIPKDAMVVVGIHTGEMRKELAWSAVTGSKLFDEMKERGNEKAPEMLKDIENAGIDFGSVIYFYTKPDKRFKGEMQTAMIMPVSDSKKLSAFIQKHVPGVDIQTINGRSETTVDGKMQLAWTDKVLIGMNLIVRKVEHQESASMDTAGGETWPRDAYTYNEDVPDSAASIAEMDLAFKVDKATSIADNSRFKTLENENHDITFWLSYDAMGEMMGNNGGLGMMGAGMANMLWSKSAMAMGVDFKKGSIDAEMKYYSSDSMKAVAQEFGKKDVDKELVERLPATGLNAALGYHLSPTALRMMVDKMGLLGMANIALMEKGMNVDDILGAFSGDIVASLNNFKMESKMQEIDSATQAEYGMTPYPITIPKMDFVVALKLGDRVKMTKLLGIAVELEALKQTAPNTYTLGNVTTPYTMILGEKYLVFGATPELATAFLKATPGKGSAALDERVAGHVMGMWADIHSFTEAANSIAKESSSDSVAMNAVKNLFSTAYINGGAFKGGANVYNMSLGFINKEENSLVQLLHLAQQLAASNSKAKEEMIP